VGKGFQRCAWTSPKGSDDEIISCAVYFGAGEVERCAEKPWRYSGGSGWFQRWFVFLLTLRKTRYLTLKLTAPASQFSLSEKRPNNSAIGRQRTGQQSRWGDVRV